MSQGAEARCSREGAIWVYYSRPLVELGVAGFRMFRVWHGVYGYAKLSFHLSLSLAVFFVGAFQLQGLGFEVGS